MASLMTRREVLGVGSRVVLGVGVAGVGTGTWATHRLARPDVGEDRQPVRVSNGKDRPPIDQNNVPKKGERIDSNLVFEFVYFAHTNLEVVKDMLADTPALVNSAWDWGGGDWETALGASGHMGRRDIAEFLIESGARVELPCAAMLGELEFVRAALKAWPRAARTPGPHGIPLMAHAKKGGERAKGVVEFLEGSEKASDIGH